MENKRKLIRIINLLVIFLIVLFLFLHKIGVGVGLFVLFILCNTIRIVLINSKKLNFFGERSYLFTFLMALFFVILGLRLAQIQILKYDKFSSLAKSQSYGKYYLKGKRGKILDSTGKELAYDMDIYKVIIDPSRFYELDHRDEIIEKLEGIKPFSVKNFDTRLEDNYKRKKKYLRIINKIDALEKDQIDQIKKDYHIRDNSIYYEHSTERKYFAYDELAPVLGFMGAFSKAKDRRTGAYGIERYYDNYLKSNKIEKKGYYTNLRQLLLPSAKKQENYIETDGNDVQLTINYYMQYILDDEMKKQYDKVLPKSAVGIIMEPSTGKILALSSYPRAKNIAYLNNRTIRSQYEMGSIFKPIIMSAAYEEQVVNDDTRLSNPDGYIMRYGHKIRDSDKNAIGNMTPQTIIRESSNVGMSLISEKLDAPTFEKYLKEFNLYNKTGLDTFGELAPKQLPYQRWDGMKKYTMSYGQGIAITPMQMIAALSTVVNGGVYYKPYIVDSVKDPNGTTIRQNIPTPLRRVISEKTSAKLRSMLKNTVENGTGKNARIPGYSIGGKTGTAQISGKGGYLRHEYTASFMGIFPAEKPKYIIVITFEKPHADVYYKKFGAWIAAPVFKNTLDRILKYRGITPENVDELQETTHTEVLAEDVPIELLPDFKGNGVRMALMVANKYNKKISIEGTGKVIEQSPKPGTKLDDIEEIKIKLAEPKSEEN